MVTFNRLSSKEALALIETCRPARRRGLLQVLRLWLARSRDRRQMQRDLDSASFTDAVLADFGMTRREAEKEASKHFWQA